jgi:hypothetical protein
MSTLFSNLSFSMTLLSSGPMILVNGLIGYIIHPSLPFILFVSHWCVCNSIIQFQIFKKKLIFFLLVFVVGMFWLFETCLIFIRMNKWWILIWLY